MLRNCCCNDVPTVGGSIQLQNSTKLLAACEELLTVFAQSGNYYYYYYYKKKRFRWRNVKRLQRHLTNAKNSDKTRVRRKVRTEYLSDAVVGRAVEIRKTSDEQLRLQLT